MTRVAWAVCLVGLLAQPAASAPDLTKIDRSIRKEPAYRTKSPKYCLLVFGLEAKTRVWLVLDEDTLYVDRDGDGDLTGADERVTVPEFKPGDGPFHEGEREIELGSVKDGELTHTGLTFSQTRYRKTLGKLDADQKVKAVEWQAYLDRIHRDVPDGVADMVSVKLAGPDEKAPILWFAWIDDGATCHSSTRRRPPRLSTSGDR